MPVGAEWHEPGRSYDPDEPLLIRWRDAIAARNAVVALMLILQDRALQLDAGLESAIRDWLPTAVAPGRRDQAEILEDRQQALAWVRELRDRLNRVLPGPPMADR
ncbi:MULTISPECIES: hypothetical protein [unclassified Nocardioides]|uniref:hypothetical protein n=1 Tax=unclassified Nocardioides TaxID=2615069 RepID=UPI0009F109DC|nr:MULTISPECIES: hypothetical protein [unclassified Nocardioides]GAW52564.1 uncharacterized protein PD653B2_4922 [Nocardioides sp. PD653-B2]GAW55597.1 uncharacterized protein PD653_3022 [Nocardioides sp. PD653]